MKHDTRTNPLARTWHMPPRLDEADTDGGEGVNCKPGDLAIIIKAILPENVGRIVRVIDSGGVHPKLGFRWNVESQNPMRSVDGVDLVTIKKPIGYAAIPDAWLRPVSGLPDEAVTTMRAREPAEFDAVAYISAIYREIPR